jgi:hypothetical protein
MAMQLVEGVPTYDNYSDWEDAHADWCCEGAELSYEKDAHTPKAYNKLMAEHMAIQPAMTQQTYDEYIAGELESNTIPF